VTKYYQRNYTDVMIPSEIRRAKRRRNNRNGQLPMGGPWGQRNFDEGRRQGRELTERLKTDPEFRKQLADVLITPTRSQQAP
jgi:hypothetical protein